MEQPQTGILLKDVQNYSSSKLTGFKTSGGVYQIGSKTGVAALTVLPSAFSAVLEREQEKVHVTE
jgi:hypothetical protein